MRWLKAFAGTFLGLLLLVALAVGVLWWWTGTEGSARWALGQVAKRQPLAAENVTGSLRHGLRAGRITWKSGGLQVMARDVELQWRPLALLQRSLELQRLHAAEVVVKDERPETGERLQPPASLRLPLRVSVEHLAIGRFEWAGRQSIELRELAAGYGFNGARHRLELRNLRFLQGHYRGMASIGAQPDFPLEATLQGRIAAPVPGGAGSVPLVFDAKAQGELQAFELQAQVRGEPGSGELAATRADVVAQVAPFAGSPLASARADVQAFDASALWPKAPTTWLSGRIAVQPQGPSAWAVSADLRNALPGPWDRKRVPAERLRLEGDWRLPGLALVRELEAQVGGGRVVARGQWEAEDAWRVEGTLTGVDPAAVHTAMAPLPLSGKATVRAQGAALSFDTELAAAGRPRSDAGAAGSEIAATVAALELRSLRAQGRWAGQELSLPLLEVQTADGRLDAALDLRPAARTGRGRADLEAPGLRVRAVGSLGPATGGGNARVNLLDVAAAQQWLLKLPGVPPAVGQTLLTGRGDLQLAWQGGWDDPTVQGTLELPSLQPASPAGQRAPWALRNAVARVDGRLAEARVDLRAQVEQQGRNLGLEAEGRGGRRAGGAWQGQFASLTAVLRDPALTPGAWRLVLQQPMGIEWSAGRLEVGASEALLVSPVPAGAGTTQAGVAWEPIRWSDGRLRTAGRVTGLPMAWVELFGGPQMAGAALSGDLVFDGRWDLLLGDELRLRASVERRQGDVSVLAETAGGGSTRVQAGVREAILQVEGQGESLTATLRWDSERAGSANARLATRLERTAGGWTWPEQAPLDGSIRAQLPRLGVWSLLAPPGWRLRGSVGADIAVAGTRGDPSLSGTVQAQDLALRSIVDGIALQDGRLRARLEGRRVVLEEFLLQGSGAEGGRLTGTGAASWQADGLQARVVATLDELRASVRSDRQLTVSGQLTATMGAPGADVRGSLRVDRARITLPDEAKPQLGEDVVVRNLPPGAVIGTDARPAANDRNGRRPLSVAVNLDLGDDFRVRGRGIETRLAGSLVVSGPALTDPRLTGAIRTVGGEYRAYGQRLEIERGVLRFTGPVDNPALDILAIRPRMTQKVGVQVTGTAQLPFVRLYAEPDLPEAEKLAWLVLGRPAASGGAETALLQSAAVALLQSRAGLGGGAGGGRGPAALLGLDELGFRRDGAEGPAVTLGKRLGRNLYASYERSLSGALGTLYVFYDLSERLTVRAQAGERSAIDLIFTFAYD